MTGLATSGARLLFVSYQIIFLVRTKSVSPERKIFTK